MDLKAFVVQDAGMTAGVALGAVALVWLIACANASSLLVARVANRRRELAVRAALGASRVRVIRHLLVEVGVLAVCGAAVGTMLAVGGITLLHNAGAAFFPRTSEIALNARTTGMLIALTGASAILFGLVPALQGSGGGIDDALGAEGRTATGSIGVRRLRRALVGSQFAIATPLLVVAALLLISLNALRRVDLGFDTHNMLTGRITLPYMDNRVATFFDDLQRRLRSLPGITSVAYSDGRPPNDVDNFNNFRVEDAPTPPGQSEPVTPWVNVSREYFDVLGLKLLEGRLLDDRDARADNILSIVVDRGWASRFFPDRSAVGKRVRQGGCSTCPWSTVVGVVTNVKYAGLDQPDEGTVYWAMDPNRMSRDVILRTTGDPSLVIHEVRTALHDLDPTVPLSNVATIDELVANAIERPQSLSFLIAALSIVALMLSTIGIYGVMAHYVQQHAKEMGIRMALGGTRREIVQLVVGLGMKVVIVGVGTGIVIAIAFARLTSTLLFGVRATDPMPMVGVSVVMVAVALVACVIPATRATRLEPATILRND